MKTIFITGGAGYIGTVGVVIDSLPVHVTAVGVPVKVIKCNM